MYPILGFLATAVLSIFETDNEIVIQGRDIHFQESMIWNRPADLKIVAEGDCVVESILGNLQPGNIEFDVGGDLIIASSYNSMAQIFSNSDIKISCQNLKIESSGTPAEIFSLTGNACLHVKENFTISAGYGYGASARLLADHINLDVLGDLELKAGAGSRCLSEIHAEGKLQIKCQGNLLLQGGVYPDRSFASIAGTDDTDIYIGRSLSLISGSGDSAQISSRAGSLMIDTQSLELINHPVGGVPKIKAAGVYSVLIRSLDE